MRMKIKLIGSQATVRIFPNNRRINTPLAYGTCIVGKHPSKCPTLKALMTDLVDHVEKIRPKDAKLPLYTVHRKEA